MKIIYFNVPNKQKGDSIDTKLYVTKDPTSDTISAFIVSLYKSAVDDNNGETYVIEDSGERRYVNKNNTEEELEKIQTLSRLLSGELSLFDRQASALAEELLVSKLLVRTSALGIDNGGDNTFCMLSSFGYFSIDDLRMYSIGEITDHQVFRLKAYNYGAGIRMVTSEYYQTRWSKRHPFAEFDINISREYYDVKHKTRMEVRDIYIGMPKGSSNLKNDELFLIIIDDAANNVIPEKDIGDAPIEVNSMGELNNAVSSLFPTLDVTYNGGHEYPKTCPKEGLEFKVTSLYNNKPYSGAEIRISRNEGYTSVVKALTNENGEKTFVYIPLGVESGSEIDLNIGFKNYSGVKHLRFTVE